MSMSTMSSPLSSPPSSPAQGPMSVPAENVVDGLPLFDSSPDYHVRALRLFPLHPGDILVTGYPQSGIKYVQLALTALLRHDRLDQFDIKRPPCVQGPIEKAAPFSKLRRLTRPTVLWSHLPYDMLPIEVRTKNIKIVHVMRNPKDVVASYYQFARGAGQYRGTWHRFYDNFMYGRLPYGDWFQYVTKWSDLFKDNKDTIFPVKFEDLLESPEYVVDDMALFLGMDLPFNMTKAIGDMVMEKISEGDQGLEFDQRDYSRSLSQYLRQERVGNWLRYFDNDQNSVFDMIYTAFAHDTGLEFKFE